MDTEKPRCREECVELMLTALGYGCCGGYTAHQSGLRWKLRWKLTHYGSGVPFDVEASTEKELHEKALARLRTLCREDALRRRCKSEELFLLAVREEERARTMEQLAGIRVEEEDDGTATKAG